jgi:hypothetical protein
MPDIDFRDLAGIDTLSTESGGEITEGQLRWWVFNADQNGLKPAIVRVGRRVYLSRSRFSNWLASQPKTSAPRSAA